MIHETTPYRRLGIFISLLHLLVSLENRCCHAFVTTTLQGPIQHNSYRFPLSPLLMQTDVPSDVEQPQSAVLKTLNVPVDARNKVLLESQRLVEKSLTGIFLTQPLAKSKLRKVVADLENSSPKTFTEKDKELFIGDWELICTARGPSFDDKVNTASSVMFPFVDLSPPLPNALMKSIRISFSVTQRIRTGESGDTSKIDRIDHVIEYTPLTMRTLIPEDSALKLLRDWNLNPLQVSTSKITLIHKAVIESLTPVFRTKISLQSVVVTVAGTSQYLDPQGADILGLNIPSLGDFLNAGNFDTTYIDDYVRISRGTLGFIDELRVFVRKGYTIDAIVNEECE